MYIVDILGPVPVHATNTKKERLDSIKVGEKNQFTSNYPNKLPELSD